MPLDIHTAVQTALVIVLIALCIALWRGIVNIRKARNLPFFRIRRETMVRGWRYLLIWVPLLAIAALLLNSRVEPLAYRFFPPTATNTLTPTMTLTPTITTTPTITLSPTITLTPAVTDTPTVTPTPHIPLAIEIQFESTVTPNPDSIFSQLTFTDGLDEQYRPLRPGTVFQNPITHMYAVFSYDRMLDGAQWTALWYRGEELVHYESIPWNGGSGGLGFTDWEPDPSEWYPDEYEVQIFVGLQWKVSGQFIVEGDPPTPAPSPTPTATSTATRTPIPTLTPWPSPTTTLTPTPRPTSTPYLSPTATIRPTTWPTLTRTPTPTDTQPSENSPVQTDAFNQK
jgi:type VI secretion system secreted protein VgrG